MEISETVDNNGCFCNYFAFGVDLAVVSCINIH